MHIDKGAASSTVLQTPPKSVKRTALPFVFHDDTYGDPIEDSIDFIGSCNSHSIDQEYEASHKPCHMEEDASSTIATAMTEELSFSEDEVSSRAQSEHSNTSTISSYAMNHLHVQEEGDCIEISLDIYPLSLSQHEEESDVSSTITSLSMELDEDASDSVEVTATWDSYSNLVTFASPSPQYEVSPRQRRSSKGRGRLLCSPERLDFSQCNRRAHPLWQCNRNRRVADV